MSSQKASSPSRQVRSAEQMTVWSLDLVFGHMYGHFMREQAASEVAWSGKVLACKV